MMNPETSALLRDAVHLNNVGVSYLASNDGGNAVKAFKHALMFMGKIIKAEGERVADQTQDRSCSSMPVEGFDDPFFVYNQALVLQVNSNADVVFANACILFNLALTFHQRGQVTGHAAKLRKACHLYELCMQLIDDVSGNAGALLVAAMNNEAAIFFQLAEYQNSARLLEAIGDMADQLYLLDLNDTQESSPFEQRHIDEFFLNAAIVRPPSAAASA